LMTTTATDSTSTHAALERALLPRRFGSLYRWFSWWVNGYLEKHFHAVRLSCGTRPSVPPDLPLIVVLNHPAWWDPLIGVVVARLLPERTHYAPMDAKALGRYSLFNKLGFYGVEQGTPRGAAAFLRATRAILSQPRSAVWITAQGEFTDPRVRPTLLRPGVGHIARRLDEGLILTLALEYPFWEERFPEALARFGEPMLIGRRRKLSARQWVELIEADLTATQDALKADALSRNAAAFETLLTGKVAIGGIYDRWRKSCAWLRGENFRAEHGPESGRP
jgi:1-acyl-sn-glycerol-3-phosphate acyltransferase